MLKEFGFKYGTLLLEWKHFLYNNSKGDGCQAYLGKEYCLSEDLAKKSLCFG